MCYALLLRFTIILSLTLSLILTGHSQEFSVLDPDEFSHYIDKFNEKDNDLYKQYITNDSAWAFLRSSIPFFECPDKNIEMTYYFRWWTFRKQIKKTPTGFVVSEI